MSTHAEAWRNHMSIKIDTESSRLIHDFMKELKFPPKLRGRFLDDKELHAGESVEGVFRRVFPNFPVLVGIVPAGKFQKMASISNFMGKGGLDLVKQFDEFALRHAALARDIAFVTLLRLPRMKPVYVLHNLPVDDFTAGFRFVAGNPSKYYLTLESLQNFYETSVQEAVQEFISNEVSGSDQTD